MCEDPRASHEGAFQVEACDEHTRNRVATCASQAPRAVGKRALHTKAFYPFRSDTVEYRYELSAVIQLIPVRTRSRNRVRGVKECTARLLKGVEVPANS